MFGRLLTIVTVGILFDIDVSKQSSASFCSQRQNSVENRAQLAPVIFHGLAVYTVPANLTSLEADTSDARNNHYSAHFWLISVYKGANEVAALFKLSPSKNETSILNIHDKKVNVSGFYKPNTFSTDYNCWKAVTSQKYYVIFAEIRENRFLTAYADNYLGAAVDWSEENEAAVWSGMGWDSWSDWAPCSVTCGQGIQERWRYCIKPPCYGYNKERRNCNMFSCEGTIEPLSTNNQQYFYPSGLIWERVTNRQSAWHIKPNYHLWLPATEVAFPVNDFQKHFALILSIRVDPSARTEGTIFSLRSRRDKNTSLSLNLRNNDVLTLVHSTFNDTQSVIIPAMIADGHWHQLALGMQDDVSVRSYLDCRWVSTDILKSNSLGGTEEADLVIGYLFTGDIEHLILVPDSGAVVKQCSNSKTALMDRDLLQIQPSAVVNEGQGFISNRRQRRRHKSSKNSRPAENASSFKNIAGSTLIIDDLEDDDDDTDEGSGYQEIADVEWSEWSACNASCGKGIQTRHLQCWNFDQENVPCPMSKNERIQRKSCITGIKCKKSINYERGKSNDKYMMRLLNGHDIVHDEVVARNTKHCKCLNGGICNPEDGRCLCLGEYVGSECQYKIKKVCYPTCQNGGTCIKGNKCVCGMEFTGDKCQFPICPEVCSDENNCKSSASTCNCTSSTTKRTSLHSSLCRQCIECKNDGVCVDNQCKCVPGWTGTDCSVAVCKPPCRNGGICVKPNECLCRPGTIGHLCEHDSCGGSGCLNGGVCIGQNICKCPANITGAFCESAICNPPCENGATCAPNNRCLCDPTIDSPRCEKKRCRYRAVQQPYTVGIRKLAKRKSSDSNCKENSISCSSNTLRSVPKYQTIYRTHYRTVYECAD